MGDYAFFEATRIFKRAVPLMVKYKVPTTPHYFSLWYTYCAQTHPALNEAVDEKVERYGMCSTSHCDSLIETFLLDDTKKEMDSFRQKLESLATDLGHSMDTTVTGTKEFQDILSSSVSKLETANSSTTISTESKLALQEVIEGSQHLLDTTSQYQLQLSIQRSEIDLLKRQLDEYKRQASHDSLTGCLNRREFDKQIRECLNQQIPFSLILADIDHFKSFNDDFGHQMGDKVLKIVAEKLTQVIGTVGAVFRYGGEEFAILVPKESQKTAYLLAEKARCSLERLSVTDKRTGQKINSITASFGVSERTAGEEKEALIARTDDALYNAKAQGRNKVMPPCR